MYDKVEREYKITLLGDPEELDEVEERLRDFLSEVKAEKAVKTTIDMSAETPIDDEEVPDDEDEEEENHEEDDS